MCSGAGGGPLNTKRVSSGLEGQVAGPMAFVLSSLAKDGRRLSVFPPTTVMGL